MEWDEFDIGEVLAEGELASSSKRTTRSVLNAMVEQGWIDKHTCNNTGRLLYSGGERLSERSSSD
jgi:hypothetical protein